MYETNNPKPIQLLRGQAYYGQLKQGSLIRVTTGTVSITCHRWVDNTLLSVTTPLPSCSLFDLPASSWCEIAAHSDAEVVLAPPQRRFPHVLRRIMTWIRPENRHDSNTLHQGWVRQSTRCTAEVASCRASSSECR
jgi:hypothetical protein